MEVNVVVSYSLITGFICFYAEKEVELRRETFVCIIKQHNKKLKRYHFNSLPAAGQITRILIQFYGRKV